jgi:purine-binding chemotaxis protein CheW
MDMARTPETSPTTRVESRTEEDDLWHALLSSGAPVATEADYERSHKAEARSESSRYVTFTIAGETYGLPIRVIDQICKVFRTTVVPRTAAFLVGIGNVNGSIMPVVDLALRLGFPAQPRTRASRVLIVRHAGELHGLVVDTVIGVNAIGADTIEEAPGGIGRSRTDFVEALGRVDDRLIILLKAETVLAAEDFVPRRFRREIRETVLA